MSMPLIAVPEGLQTGAFLLGPGALKYVPELLAKYFPGLKPWIIADGNTWRAAGEEVSKRLTDAGMAPAEPYLFPADPRPHPDYAISQKLASIMPQNCVPVAVGSGVINDLVKCAAGIRKVRYCCVATACSVDGYTSNGGAMTVEGTKKTVPCSAPYAICADVDVLKTAPAPMFAAGYADLLAKIPGGADWVIADTLGIEPIRQDIWELIQVPLRERIADPSNMGPVFAGLASTGYGMQMYLDSRPASGAEHLFSHIWEMEGLTFHGEDVSHGFKVGIGTLMSTLLMEYVVLNDFDSLRPRMKKPLTREERLQEIAALTVRGCYGPGPKETAMKKYLTPEQTLERRQLIGSRWEQLRQGIKKQYIPFEELRAMLKKAKCPTTPAEIGLTREQFFHAVPAAQLIRTRYTVLDTLYECGLLDDACKMLEKML
ncbi:MAG: sn-glycerol-1-phosphate dehydrogenase [Lentisphaeria bacterium]|nr:sn-glycerol-1-phosphate dehydrogenase [Lentisphaeria bacterium]